MKYEFYKNNNKNIIIEFTLTDLLDQYSQYLETISSPENLDNINHMWSFFSTIGTWTFSIVDVESKFLKVYLKSIENNNTLTTITQTATA
jgi:hypothetical protein